MNSKNIQKIKHQKYSVKKDVPINKHTNGKKYFDFLGLSAIVMLGIIIYSNSFNCSFHFDDASSIVANKAIQNLSDIKAWWNYSSGRPIAYFTFAVNYHYGELNVWGYHLVNLIIHLITSCIVGWLTLLIFSTPALKNNPIIKHKKILAFFVALLFVSHPLATQSVTYIVQRMASLVAMFYLLSLALYVKGRLSEKGITKYFWFAGALVSAVLALLTKENAYTLPFAVILFEIFFLQTKKIKINFKDYRIILLMVAFLSIMIFMFSRFSLSIFKPISPTQGNTNTITSMNYLFTQFSVIVKYIQLLFLPINQNADYDFPIANSFFGIRTLLSFLFLIALIGLAIFLFKRNRVISFGIFWFFITLAIESSIVPIDDVIFEHRTYLPSFGFFLILISLIYFLLWNKYKFHAIGILILIIVTNSFMTFNRNKVWKDEVSLWSDAVLKSPNKARPVNNLGFAFKILGQMDNAMRDFTKAIEINPRYPDPYFLRATIYDNLKQWDKAIANYSMVIDINPKHAKAYCNLGIAFANLGQYDKAIASYASAIKIDPRFQDAFYNRGIAYSSIKLWKNAIADYSKAIEIDSKYTAAYSNRGIAYANLWQYQNAISDYSKAIEIDPKYIIAYNNRGYAYSNIGDFEKAIADYSKALAIDPNFTAAYANRDYAYAQLKNKQNNK